MKYILLALEVIENFIISNVFKIRLKLKWINSLDKVNLQNLGRKITFLDDFDNRDLNEKVWTATLPCGNRLLVESKTLFMDKYRIEDSCLKIDISKENGYFKDWEGNEGDYDYITSHFHTRVIEQLKPGFQQQYGRFEACMKTSGLPGTWPAFWLLSKRDIKGCTDILPEIDVVEGFGDEYKGFDVKIPMQFTLHYGKDYNTPDKRQINSKVDGYDFSNQFYVYAVEVRKKTIKWYINGHLVKKIYQDRIEAYNRAYFPLFLIIGQSINHKWMEKYCNYYNFPINNSLEIDYVRVFE